MVDSNIQKIYSIEHSNLFIIDAIESNKTIEQSLELCEFLLSKNFSKKNIDYTLLNAFFDQKLLMSKQYLLNNLV
mgnify:CR=1 FL=1